MTWRIRHRAETVSTNLDARDGRHGDVFTADLQTGGRGRLDHRWLSPAGVNLMMSAVLSAADIPAGQVATLPLVAGLAVADAVRTLLGSAAEGLVVKWPNDVLVDGRKLAGILCERQGDNVIVGIGVNVGQTEFPPEIAATATSLARLTAAQGACPGVAVVRDAVLDCLAAEYGRWRREGFAAVLPRLAALDCLRGRLVTVRQTADDPEPVRGVCAGIGSDGTLLVGDSRVYAGEAHVMTGEEV